MFFSKLNNFIDNNIKHRQNIDLSAIKHFYRIHPQKYIEDNFDVPAEAYELYGTVLILNGYGNCASVQTGYPVYFYRECHISDARQFHITLIMRGFFCKPDIYQLFNSYTVAELKQIAGERNILKKGRKAELINRLIDTIPPDEQQKYIDSSCKYVLSDKGRSFLKTHSDLIEYHRFIKYDIPFPRFYINRFPDGVRRRTFNDNAFQILSERIYKDTLRNYYWSIERDFYSLYEITSSEYMYSESIKYFLQYLYIKTCCVHSAYHYAQYFYTKPKTIDEPIFFSKIAIEFIELKQFYSPILVDNIYNDLSLPPNFLTCEEFKELLDDMLNENVSDYQKYNDLINRRLLKYSHLK